MARLDDAFGVMDHNTIPSGSNVEFFNAQLNPISESELTGTIPGHSLIPWAARITSLLKTTPSSLLTWH